MNSQQLGQSMAGTMENEVPQVPLKPHDLPENVLGYERWTPCSGSMEMPTISMRAAPAGQRGRRAVRAARRSIGYLSATAVASHRCAGGSAAGEYRRHVAAGSHFARSPAETGSAGWKQGFIAGELDGTGGAASRSNSRAGQGEATATVSEWTDWKGDGSDLTPFLVRQTVGLGAVTWVAADLGDPQLSLNAPRWPIIWDRIFGWNNATVINPSKDVQQQYSPTASNPSADAAAFLFKGTDQEGKGAGLLGVAIVFFIIYWLAAGPGSFMVLANRKRKELSWFVFAAAAIIAAGFTVVLVKIVLRGSPELKHMSISQTAPGRSHAGPQPDRCVYPAGRQPVDRAGGHRYRRAEHSVGSDRSSSVPGGHAISRPPGLHRAGSRSRPAGGHRCPFPQHAQEAGSPVGRRYAGGIVGSAQLLDPSDKKSNRAYIVGTLTNQTGYDLQNVYFGFHHPVGFAGRPANWVLFVPFWKKGDALDLGHEFGSAPLLLNLENKGPDWTKDTARALIDHDWSNYWYSYLDGIGNSDSSSGADVRANMPMLTFFDLLPPPRNQEKIENNFSLLRRGGRNLNLSAALLAGKLVVVAAGSFDGHSLSVGSKRFQDLGRTAPPSSRD